MNFINFFISINVFSFIFCYIDKKRAIKHHYRISENNLLLISILGGCFGMLFAMYLFHHKTKKIKFKLVHIFCVFWILIYLIY